LQKIRLSAALIWYQWGKSKVWIYRKSRERDGLRYKKPKNEFWTGLVNPEWNTKNEWAAEAAGEETMESSRVRAAYLFQVPCYALIDAHASCTLPVTYMPRKGNSSNIHDCVVALAKGRHGQRNHGLLRTLCFFSLPKEPSPIHTKN